MPSWMRQYPRHPSKTLLWYTKNISDKEHEKLKLLLFLCVRVWKKPSLGEQSQQTCKCIMIMWKSFFRINSSWFLGSQENKCNWFWQVNQADKKWIWMARHIMSLWSTGARWMIGCKHSNHIVHKIGVRNKSKHSDIHPVSVHISDVEFQPPWIWFHVNLVLRPEFSF